MAGMENIIKQKGCLPVTGSDAQKKRQIISVADNNCASEKHRKKERKVVMAKITINDLLEAGCHFGHQTRRWNPKMKKYVYGAKNGISIIDLTKTMRPTWQLLRDYLCNGGQLWQVPSARPVPRRDCMPDLCRTAI